MTDQQKSILFISSNEIWGGSEVLWTETALRMSRSGYLVHIACYYNNEQIKLLLKEGVTRHNLIDVPGKLQRVTNYINRTVFKKSSTAGALSLLFQKHTFDLIVLSQGNTVSSLAIMEELCSREVKFVTVSQLVTEFSWLFADDDKLQRLSACYKVARRNYFVSDANLQLHTRMLGTPLTNAELVFNPFKIFTDSVTKYPSGQMYRAAIVGRIEFMHKGLDLLLDVISSAKWQSRNILFTFYGTGPHSKLLAKTIHNLSIKNAVIHGHITDIQSVWKENQILIMSSRMEGQSLALIEAMHANRTAIVTNVGGVREMITDGLNGYIAKCASIDDLDEAMDRAWLAREDWEELGRRAGEKLREIYPSDPIEYFSGKLAELLHPPINTQKD